MVLIQNIEHFREALKFARTQPKEARKSLRASFRTLNRIKRNGPFHYGEQMILCLYPDWVKHSFAFGFKTLDNRPIGLSGGLILHGYEETFSVEINPCSGPHWSIHT